MLGCHEKDGTRRAAFSTIRGSIDPDTGQSWPLPLTFGVEAVQATWLNIPDQERPKHPAVPLVEAWQARPSQVEPDCKRRAIAPLVLKATQLHPQEKAQSDRSGQLPLVLSPNPVGEWPHHTRPEELPFLELPRSGQLVPALPVQLYDRAGGVPQSKRKGAPIGIRLFFEALFSIPRQDRLPHTSQELMVTLGDMAAWIWPKGWDRKRNLPALVWALKDLGELRIEWERRLWNLVVARSLPTWETKLSDLIVLHVFSLPDSDRGPMIDRSQLRHWGLKSAISYRIYLRLAYLWDDVKSKRGGYRVYANRPKVRRNEHGHLIDAKGRSNL